MADQNATMLTREERHRLADRLVDHADGIVNVAAHEMELDLRRAAAELRAIELPRLRATLPGLKFELTQIAARCSDAATVRQLRILSGEE